jgi:glutathione synthase
MSSSSSETQELIDRASSWCASHGVLMGARDEEIHRTPLGPYIYEPAPFSLYPTDFSQVAFQKAYQLAKPFNKLVHAVAQNRDWLLTTLAPAAASDADFTGRLVQLAHDTNKPKQSVVLGIFRSDYMLHSSSILQQVELNTIASSFGSLSAKITKLHQEMNSDDTTTTAAFQLPDNTADQGIVQGLALAHYEYIRQFPASRDKAVVVMVVQPGETNACDQRDLEFLLHTRHQISLLRYTLAQLATGSSYNDHDELVLSRGAIASVVYYRAGYTPHDYPTDLEWKGRRVVEDSHAIKCPDVFHHLAGAKKIQQALAVPGVLERWVHPDEAALLRSCFAGLYALGDGDDQDTVDMALKHPERYVLKPQREGGGNNLYHQDLVDALEKMSYNERGAYILMSKIQPPVAENSLVRRGKIVYQGPCVCELGVFGISLRRYDSNDVLHDEAVGHILRAKSVETDEGGVAAGYAFLSSPKLV